jgi:hypothetical protein
MKIVRGKVKSDLEKRIEDSVLETVAAHGIPIPLRIWAAAGRIDADTLLYELRRERGQ